jgi:hypothetical protein
MLYIRTIPGYYNLHILYALKYIFPMRCIHINKVRSRKCLFSFPPEAAVQHSPRVGHLYIPKYGFSNQTIQTSQVTSHLAQS